MSQSPLPNLEIDKSSDWPEVLASVRDYWLAKRGKRAMPARADISPKQLKPQLPHILLADVVDGGRDFRYRLVGTLLQPFFQTPASGKLMSEIIAPFGKETLDATLECYRGAIARRDPMRLTGSGSWFGQEPKQFDALLAPLSDDGVTVNMILGTFVFVWDQEHQFRKVASPPAVI